MWILTFKMSINPSLNYTSIIDSFLKSKQEKDDFDEYIMFKPVSEKYENSKNHLTCWNQFALFQTIIFFSWIYFFDESPAPALLLITNKTFHIKQRKSI